MIESTELVELVMKRLNVATDAELADILGLPRYGERKVKRWRTGENEPDYTATMQLLELIGAVNLEELGGPLGHRLSPEEARLARALLRDLRGLLGEAPRPGRVDHAGSQPQGEANG